MILGIYGAGGFGRDTMQIVKRATDDFAPTEIFYVDDFHRLDALDGKRVLSHDEFRAIQGVDKVFNIAIADSKVRARVAARCLADGMIPHEVSASNAWRSDVASIGPGAILCPFTCVMNAKIGRFFHLNIYSYVEHDCVIGDFVTFAPSVHCNGNVHVEDHAYIGTGAVIKQGSSERPLVIGAGAIVGMGAIVTKSVPTGATVVGNPARPRP